MNEIADFIAQRLAEDETIARAAAKAGGTDWDWGIDEAREPSEAIRYGVFVQAGREPVACIDKGEYDSGALSQHIARHDPARVLRQCAALRRIVSDARDIGLQAGDPTAEDAYARPFLAAVAAIWSNHPAYQSEWAVDEGGSNP